MNTREIQRRLERLEQLAEGEKPTSVVVHCDDPAIDGRTFTTAEAAELEKRLGRRFIRIFVKSDKSEH